MNIDFARLNHILIPPTKEGRDRFRRGRLARALRPLTFVYATLTPEGRMFVMASLVVGGFGLDVGSTDVYVLWCALFGLLIGSLALARAHRAEGVSIEVQAPRRVTVGEDLRFSIELHNQGPRDIEAVRVGGPFLPWDGHYTGAAPRLPLLRAGERARVEAAARFVSRGEHHLDPFTAAALVPFGLATGPAVASEGVRFIVVPRVAPVTRLSLPMGRRHQPGGVPLASKTGESMELAGVRPYRAGDPVRHLHARSWARVGAPVVREYQEEYFSRVGVILEMGAEDARQIEAGLSLAAGVIAHLSRGEALIDLLVVGERVHDLTLGRHLGFLEQALDLLACVGANERRAAPDRLIASLAEHLPRLSCVVVITPSWDGGALSARIRERGVGCSTLVITRAHGREDAPAAYGKDAQRVSAAAIARGEALSL